MADAMLTKEQQRMAILGPCFVLGFLVDSEQRHNARKSMQGFSDAAIFNRWMSLAWTLSDSETIALLNDSETDLLNQFNQIYDSIQWQPIASHPFMSDTSETELNRLVPVAKPLLQLLRKRACRANQSSWWTWMKSQVRSIAGTDNPSINPIDRRSRSATSALSESQRDDK